MACRFGPSAEQISMLSSTNESNLYKQLEKSSENADETESSRRRQYCRFDGW
jgi:hypothetical protein